MIIKDLSLQTILGSIRGQLNRVEDRRTKDRYNMLSYYEGMTDVMEQDIARYFDSDSLRQAPPVTESITPKLVNGRAIVYKQTPMRQVDEKYLEFTDDLDSAMLQFERMTYLLGTMALKSNWNEEDQKINYVPLTEFYPIFLPHEEEPVACMYPIYNYSTNTDMYDQIFAFWSDTDHFLINGKGQIVEQEENPDRVNPYGVKPIVYAHRQILTTDWFREGCSDIVSMNKTVNIMLTEMSLSMRLQMLGQPVLEGVDEANMIKMGVDKPLVLPEGAHFKFESPSGGLQQYVEAMRFLVDSVAYNHNMKTKWSVGREGMMSGESLKMAEIELTESVILDAQMIWRPVEKQRFEVDRAIIEYETGSAISEDYSVDFTEPRFPLTAQEERNQWDWEWQNGLASKKDWFRKYNPDADDDMLEEMETRVDDEGTPQTEDERARESTKFDLKKAIGDNGNT